MRRLSFLILFFISTSVGGTEFWMEARARRVAVGQEVIVDFREGDSFTGEPWDFVHHPVAKCLWYSTGVTRDLIKVIQPTRGKNLVLKLPTEGTQVIVLEGKPVVKKWSSQAFKEFCEAQEMDGYRADVGDSLTEVLTHSAREVLQVGSRRDDTYKKKTDLVFEILPLQHPEQLKVGDYLTCVVTYQGKPVPHQLVKVWSRLKTTTFLQNIYTEKNGTVAFPISTRGGWMVSAVRLQPDVPRNQMNVMATTLTFGVE